MKKGIVITLLLMSISLAACGKTAEQKDNNVVEEIEEVKEETKEEKEEVANVANPWTISDKQGILDATGFEMNAPDGATDVEYSYMADGKMAQMAYVYEDADWVYRIQPTEALTDISGMNYSWIVNMPGEVSGQEAQYLGYSEQAEDSEFIDDMFFVMVVNWYDANAKATYSLSASGCNLDGMDIQVYAENIYGVEPKKEVGASQSFPDDFVTIPFTNESQFHPEDYNDLVSNGTFGEADIDNMMEGISDMLRVSQGEDWATCEGTGGNCISQEFYQDEKYGTRVTYTTAWTGNDLVDAVMKKVGYKDYEVNYYYPVGIWISADEYPVRPVYASLYIDGNGYEYYFCQDELVRRNGPEGESINPKTNDFINSIYKIGCYYGNTLVGERNRYSLMISSLDAVEQVDDHFVLSGEIMERNANVAFIIDKDTVFDNGYNAVGFEGLKDGEAFFDWYSRSYAEGHNQEDGIISILIGIWDIKTTGNHVDAVCGTYWWD